MVFQVDAQTNLPDVVTAWSRVLPASGLGMSTCCDPYNVAFAVEARGQPLREDRV